MQEKIKKYLTALEKKKDIEILLACETGSRAWGFPSPDSDYDVRFIYRRKKDWYLHLQQQKDSIDVMYEDNEIDLSGWDLRKSLLLLAKSNPALLERIQSPVLYKVNEAFLTGIRAEAEQQYSKIATMFHYLSMAKKKFEEVQSGEKMRLKSMFYALRTSVACLWITKRDTMPPIVFQEMLENLDIDAAVKKRIYELINLKATASESYMHPQEKLINDFIAENIAHAEAIGKTLPGSKGKLSDMNAFFIKTVSGT